MSCVGKLRSALVGLALLCGAPGPAGAVDEAGVAYAVRFRGDANKALTDRLRDLSQTVALQRRPPTTLPLLNRRIDGDLDRFAALLASEGYFAGIVDPTVAATVTPVRVEFTVATGPRYRVDRVHTTLPPDSPAFPFLDARLAPGDPVSTQVILDAEQRLVRQLRNHGYPFAAAGTREVVVDHDARTIDVTFAPIPGRTAGFGELRLEGRTQVRESAIRKRISWSPGAPFNAEKVEAFRQELLATGMFLAVSVEPDASPSADGTLPLRVRVTERKRRTLTLGLEYESDIGFGVNLDWAYRNFLTREVQLDMSARVSEIELAYEIQLARARFLHPDQTFAWNSKVAEDSPDAYTSLYEEMTVQVTRRFSRQLRVSGGIAAKVAEVEQGEATENYALLLSPWTLDFNVSNDLLDPSTGGRAILKFAPYTDLRGGDLTFSRSFGEYRHFLSHARWPGLVLAGRIALGVLSGAAHSDIPADERFYAGGGGSIRGYEYQSVGYLVNGQPVGGNSLAETSLEIRTRFGDHWGLVGFLDGGNTFESSTPHDELTLQWGAGVGVRIFTDFGPIRVDVAVPVNPREDLDEDYQFYISLGQAF